jgi:MFS transporter, SP family, arabinose:H+ symporter
MATSMQGLLSRLDQRTPTSFYWQLTLLATIGGFLFGYDTSNIGSALSFVPYHLTGLGLGYLVSGASLGAAAGALLAGPLTDRFGRKVLLVADAGLYAAGAILSAFAWNEAVLLIARTIIGLAIGADSAIATAYISEYAPRERRGSLGLLQQWMITIGILVAYLVALIILNVWPGAAYSVDWRLILGLGAVPALIGLALRFRMPESPRWLLRHHRYTEMRQALGQLGIDASQQQIQAAGEELAAEERQRASDRGGQWTAGVRRALMVVVVFFVFQQITGINIPFYYGPHVLGPLFQGGSTNPVSVATSGVLVTTILTVVNVVATYFAFRFIDRVGRRRLALGGFAGMAVFILVAAAALAFLSGTAQIVAVMIGFSLFIASFAIGVGGTGWLIQGEVFPTAVRGRAAAIGATADWLANFALVVVFPVWQQAIGLAWVMVCFAALALLAILFVSRFLPETKGLSVEDITAVFERQAGGRSRPSPA